MLDSSARNRLVKLGQKYPKKRAFITGAGSGLGLALASELARFGWTIGINDLSQERLKLASEQIASLGGTSMSYPFDVSDFDSFSKAVSEFLEKNGGVDLVINNAGIGCGGYLHELPFEVFRRVVEVNFMGVAHGCYLFLPALKQQKTGHILNVASAAAFVSAPRMSAYNSSKSAVVALSETLRAELAEDSVLVSVLLPTYLQTNIGNDAVGAKEDVELAKFFVERSGLSAETVAVAALTRMVRGDLYIVLPEDARFLWRFKRLMPDRFWRFISKEARRRIARIENR